MSSVLFAQSTYYSKSSATNFNLTSSWGTNIDGSGAAPGSISAADNFIIANGSVMTLSSSASVRRLEVGPGSLTMASNTLDVAITGANNTQLLLQNGGTLTVSGGTLNINGALYTNSGSTLNQSGGNINVDPNNAGVTASSFQGSSIVFGNDNYLFSSNNVSLTGGTLTLVDPPEGGFYCMQVYGSFAGSFNVTAGHTFRFGDGVSTDVANFWSTTTGVAQAFVPILRFGATDALFPFGNVTFNRNAAFGRFTNAYSPLLVQGTLTVNSTAVLQYSNIVAHTGLFLKGNVVNNGRIESGSAYNLADFSYGSGTITAGFFSGSQAFSGSGTFRNAFTPNASTANFASVQFANQIPGGVVFASANSLLSGTNTGTMSGTLTLNTGCRVNTSGNSNPFILGVSATTVGAYTAGATQTYGFTAGSKFRRWFTATGTVLATSPTATSILFPMLGGEYPRYVYLNKSANLTFGGWIEVSHTNTSGLTADAFTDPDGSYNVQQRTNGGWTFTTGGSLNLGTSTLALGLGGEGLISASDASYSGGTAPRLVQAGAAVQTHTVPAGSSLAPIARRQALTQANLINTHYIGINSGDLGLFSIGNGNWNNPAIWSTGSVPIAGTNPIISTGTTVTVNSAEEALTVKVDAGGTLNVSGSTLNVTGASGTGILVVAGGNLNINGGTLNLGPQDNSFCNRSFTLNGNLNVSSGNLNIAGRYFSIISATHTQSGGTIKVDGNAGGVLANSISTSLVTIASSSASGVTFTGGTFTIVDPSANSVATNSLVFTNNTPGKIDISAAHTFNFGDGSSSDNGGNATFGLLVTASSVAFTEFGSVVVNFAGGSNRFLANNGTIQFKNLNVGPGAEFRQTAGSNLGIAGALNVDGTATFNGTVRFATINATGSLYITSALAQSIGGLGTIQNLLASPTGTFTNLYVDNSGSGLTLNIPVTIPGQLSIVNGKINTTSTNILTMTSTSGNVFTGTSSAGYVNGPMNRVVPASTAIGTFNALMPVGKSGANWLNISPATDGAGSVTIQAEVFDANAGTADLLTLSTFNAGRRWELTTSGVGAITSYNATVYDNNAVSGSAVAGSATAAGTYSALSTGTTFAAATAALPKSLTTSVAVTGNVSPHIGFGFAGPKDLGTIAVVQQVGNVSKSTLNNNILRINIPVTGAQGTIDLDQLVFTYSGTDPADIDLNGVTLWSGNASSPIVQLAAVSLSGSTATFSSLSSSLAIGNNYYWIRLNVASTATLGNTIDGRVNTGALTFTITSPVVLSGTYPGSDLNPALDRLIDYCPTENPDGSCNVDVMTNVVLNGSTINLANPTTCPSAIYNFYNALNKPDLQQNATYTLSVSVGTDPTNFVGVWIDFNRNGFFETTEFFNGGNPGSSGTANISILVPAGADLGDTRMRIRGGDDAALTSSVPCGASNSTYGETEDYVVTIISPISCASIGSWPASTTTTSSSFLCSGSSVSFDLSVPMPVSTGLSYQLQLNGVNLGTSFTLLPVSRSITTTGTYRILARCNGTTVMTSTGVLVTALNPQVASSTGATRCGSGTLTLSATPSAGATIKWFSDPTDGVELSVGNSYVTPNLSVGTTSYYASAQESFGIENVGPSAPVSGFTEAQNLTGIRFNATVPVTINTAVIYPVGTGTIVLAVLNSSGAYLSETAPISIVGGTGAAVTINVGLNILAGNAQKLVLKNYTGSVALTYNGAAITYPQTSASGVFSITSGWRISGPFSNYFYFYNLNISRVCVSNRVAVTGVVNPAPPINFLGANTNICSGLSQTVTAQGNGYTSYNWSPGGAGATKVLAPSATTTYTVTATGGLCSNVNSFTVLVKPSPSNPVITSVAPVGGLCKGSSKTYTGNSALGGGDYVVFRGDFNEGNTDGYQFQSSGTLTTNWKLANGPTSYNADFINFSPNGSPFVWVNSDELGPGAGVSRMITPSISTVGLSGLSLRFTHAFRTGNPSNTGTVQYSTDGGSTWSGNLYSTSPNASVPSQSWIPSGFLVTTTTIVLPGAADNKANLKFRFTYNYDWEYYWFIDDIEVFTPAVNQYSWTSLSSFAGIPGAQQAFDVANTSMTATPTEGGAYTIVLTTKNTANCQASSTASNSFNVSDVVLAPSNSGPQRSGKTISFNSNVSGGFGAYSYEWTKLPSPTIVNTNQNWNITTAPSTATGTYQITATDAQGCSATQTTDATVFDAIVWNGSVDGDWNNSSNWTPSIVPTVAASCSDPIVDNVIITNSGTPPVYPNTGQFLQSFGVESGVVNLSAGINVCGSLSGGTGTVGTIAGVGTVSLVGTGTSFIGGNLLTDRLIINKTGGQVRFQGTTTINDLLTISTAAASINVEASGRVILASSPSSTGKVGPIPSGTAISVTAPGKFVMQRNISVPSGGRWYFMGSPIVDKFFSDYSDDFVVTGLSSGFGGQGGGINSSAEPERSTILKHVESETAAYLDTVQKNGWRIPGALEKVTPGVGYRVFVNPYSFSGVLDNEGLIFSGNKTFTLTRNASTNCQFGFTNGFGNPSTWPVACSEKDRGWNFLANPYPSPIDWDAAGWTKPLPDMSNAFFTWNASSNGYQAYESSSGQALGNTLNSGPNAKIIASSQGFFVKLASGNNLSLVATEAVKSTTNGSFFRTATATDQVKIRLTKDGSSDVRFDGMIRFDSQSTFGMDINKDLEAFTSPGAEFSFVGDNGESLWLSTIPVPTETKVMPISIAYGNVSGNYSFTFLDGSSISNGAELFLKDNYLGTLTSMNTSSTSYSFFVNVNDASSSPNRFEVVISGNAVTGVSKFVNGVGFGIYPNPSSSTSNVTLAVGGAKGSSASIVIVDVVGKVVYTDNMAISQFARVSEKSIDLGLPAGVYTVKVITSGKTFTDKLIVR